VLEAPAAPIARKPVRPPHAEVARARARELIDVLPSRHLETVCGLLSFLIERKAGNSLHEGGSDAPPADEQSEGEA
jgi:hypothetical protein